MDLLLKQYYKKDSRSKEFYILVSQGFSKH